MSYNISYFIGTLSNSFDTWNVSTKLDYFVQNLEGFSRLNQTTQKWVVENVTYNYLAELWNLLVNNPSLAIQDGLNATQTFLYYLASPTVWQDFLMSGFTTASTENVTTPPPDPCLYISAYSDFFVILMLLPATAVVLLLTFFKSRKHMCLRCCWGRPHLIYPVNFLDEYSHRWAYAMVFVIITYKVLKLFNGSYFWQPAQFLDPVWMKTYGWTKVFVVMLNVAWMCVVYYPFLACLSLRKMILANILGLAYMAPWIWSFVDIFQICPFWKKVDSANPEVAYEAIIKFIFDVPVLIAYLILIISYLSSLCINIYVHYLKRKQVEEYEDRRTKKIMKDPQPILYLRHLLKPKVEAPSSCFGKVKNVVKYTKVDGFHYSPRLICTMVVAALALFKLCVEITVLVNYLFITSNELYSLTEPFFQGQNLTADFEFFREYLYVARWSAYFGLWVSFLLHVAFMIHMSMCYRQHLRQYFKGNRTWHHEVTSSPATIMAASLRYSGYQIAYLLYGFLILGFLLVIVLFAFGVLIALPIKYKYINWVIRYIIEFWPTLVLGFLVYFVQVILSKLFLLQDFGKYMALNNRRFYHNMNFIVFFYNVIVGLFACLRRILMSMLFGILLLSRLDRCLLMRGFERFDTGFNAYLAMLTVDVYHNHPVLKAFVYYLWQSIENCDTCGTDTKVEARYTKYNDLEKDLKGDNSSISVAVPQKKRSLKWRNKWHKAITLIHNPSLRLDLLKDELKESRNKEDKHFIRDFIVNRAGDVTAGVIVGSALGKAFDEI